MQYLFRITDSSDVSYPSTLREESGFTLIELLCVIGILGILSSLSYGAFRIYMDDAEYSRAEITLRSARTALEVGEQEAAPGFKVDYETTNTDGGAIGSVASSDLADVMPGAVTPKGVRLGVEFLKCTNASGPLEINQQIISEPCKSTKQVQWTRYCNGIEVYTEEVAQAKGCP